MENKIEVFKTLLILVLILAIMGIFTIPQYLENQYETTYQEGYQTGVNDSIINLATQQTQSGNILLVYNNSLQAFPIATLCQLGSGVQ